MNINEAMQARHSVRSYTDKPIDAVTVQKIKDEIDRCNKEGGLHISLVTDEPKAFGGMMAHYGNFKGVRNYIAMVGKKSVDLDERLGYYGERIVLFAQTLGLNTCWVALTYSKRKAEIEVNRGEKLVCVISLGYGETQGKPHNNKPMEQLCKSDGEKPDWFINGMKAAMLAPTAVNQQKFMFTLNGGKVKAEALKGPYSVLDLGIVKYHFELGAGRENFTWA